MRPEPGTDPRTWGTDELAYQMERAGLGGTCTTAFKKAGIDGRVALTLTAADEEEIRDGDGLPSATFFPSGVLHARSPGPAASQQGLSIAPTHYPHHPAPTVRFADV